MTLEIDQTLYQKVIDLLNMYSNAGFTSVLDYMLSQPLKLTFNTLYSVYVNTALEKVQSDGTIDSIINNYIGSDSQIGKTPYEKKDVERKNGTLKIGTNAEFPPYSIVVPVAPMLSLMDL